MPLAGGCHCGAIALRFDTALRADEIPLRACACSFCRKHGVRAASDPAGRVSITVAEAASLVRYRFDLGTADFLVCGRCGIYVGAIIEDGGRLRATINVNTLDDAGAFSRAAQLVDYAGETAEQRRARRLARWTPAELLDRNPS